VGSDNPGKSKCLLIENICSPDKIYAILLNKNTIENMFISLLHFFFQLQFLTDRIFIVTEFCIIYTVL
jgi:hypothetical protein